jgi:integrase/recombinase XerD
LKSNNSGIHRIQTNRSCPTQNKEHILNEDILLGAHSMAAARTLTAAEIQVVQHYISKHAYSKRNSMMFALSAFAGMRVGEIAGLVLGDVRGSDGLIRAEIQLASHRVKHGTARTVYLNTRLQQQMADYVGSRRWIADTQPLFPTHRGPLCAFTPNTLAQHFYWLYRRCNLRASSHSGGKFGRAQEHYNYTALCGSE